MSRDWTSGLFDCFSPLGTCCMASWCPCILYGQTQGRRDGESSPSCCNGSCMGYAALQCCSLQWILQTINRGAIRHEHGIGGNGCVDCLISSFCCCCALIQEDKEVREGKQGVFVPTGGPPKPQAQMAYGPPQ